jgi:hypothetical protein
MIRKSYLEGRYSGVPQVRSFGTPFVRDNSQLAYFGVSASVRMKAMRESIWLGVRMPW